MERLKPRATQPINGQRIVAGREGTTCCAPVWRKCEGAARYGLLFGRAGFTFRALELETCTSPGFTPRGFVTLRA
jgi:hypothetical protein